MGTLVTNANGEYLADLANFEHGYSDGDNITITLLIDPIVEKTTYVDLTNHPDGREVHFFIPSQPTSVGGIYISVNKLELLAPYIGLITLLAVAVTTVGYIKKRKKHTRIIS